jgi:hypothetical protein
MNQSEYSPIKTSIRFDSLHSEYLKEANMGHPSPELKDFQQCAAVP